MNRRDFFQVGALALGNLTLADVLRLRAQGNDRRAPRSVIMVWLPGGPSHIDMYDLKPEAPIEYRGQFRPIKTNVPGFDICELMPLQARIADKLALVRTLQFVDPISHNPEQVYTGYLGSAQRPPFGSVISRFGRGPKDLPAYVSLGKRIYRGAGGETLESEDPYYLGAAHGPMYVETNVAAANPAVRNLGLNPAISIERQNDRRALLNVFDAKRRELDASSTAHNMDVYTGRAMDLLTSSRAREAFDLEREPKQVRQRYDLQPGGWGRKFLMARRLVEAGVSVVTLQAGSWDTHVGNFTSLAKLLPMLDHSIHALVTDLCDRGLDKEVLVIVQGEMGRTPKISPARANVGAGRNHWPQVAFALFAGAVRTGQVIGETDSRAELPKTRGLHPQDILATIYHALGIDPKRQVPDFFGRPTALLDDVAPITELVG
jgi:uncharacterized protein (DUF1501 family)